MIKITKHQKFSDFCGLKIPVEIFKLKENTSKELREVEALRNRRCLRQ